MSFTLAFKGDKIIWIVSCFLLLMGCAMFIVNINYIPGGSGNDTIGAIKFFLIRHFIFVLTGFVLMVWLAGMDVTKWTIFLDLLFFAFILLVIYTNIFGVKEGLAFRKLKLGPVSIQPAEFLKILMIIRLAKNLAIRQKRELKDFKVIPLIVECAGVILLIALNSNSAGGILFITCLFMFYIGKSVYKTKNIVYFAIVSLIGLVSIMFIKGRGAILVERVEMLINKDINKDYRIGPDRDTKGLGQQDLAIVAVATAKPPLGALGGGNIKDIIPYGYSDCVYSILVEEFGLIIGILVILAYLVLLYRAIQLTEDAKKSYGALLSIGLCVAMCLQAFIHIFVNIGIFPVTGQTLPLISQGGSSILAVSGGIGLMLSVSKREYLDPTTE